MAEAVDPVTSSDEPTPSEEAVEDSNIIDGRYEVLSILGEGGFGVVYKARQISTGQIVAVKLLHADLAVDETHGEEYSARFEREMRLIGSLKHPNVVRLIDKGRLENGELFMVLEYIEGQALFDVLENEGPLSLKDAYHIMGQVLDALYAAHEIGIVHRDLKPHNIMLTRTGYRLNATVLDFGIAGVVEGQRSVDYRTLTKASEIRGTPNYMAPEQLRAKSLTPQSDIYAWGLVFVECLTGYPAVEGESPFDTALMQVGDEPVSIPDGVMNDAVYDIVRRSTAKPLDERYTHCGEVFADMDQVTGLGAIHTSDISFDGRSTSESLDTSVVRAALREGRESDELASADTAVFSDSELDAYAESRRQNGPSPRPNLDSAPSLDGQRVTIRGSSPELPTQPRGVPIAVVIGVAVVALGVIAALTAIVITRDNAGTEAETTEEATEKSDEDPAIDEATRLISDEPMFDEVQRAVALYAEALERNVDSGRAHAGLAFGKATMARMGWEVPQKAWPEVKREAEAALAIDDTLATAHAAKAMVLLYFERDFEGSGRSFARAAELDPAFGAAYAEQLLGPLGQFDEAQKQIETARANADGPDVDLAAGLVAYYQGRYDDAASALNAALSRRPDSFLARYRLGLVHAARGEFSAAAGELETARRLQDESMVLGALAYVSARNGSVDKANAHLELLVARESVGGRVLPDHLALAYIGLNDNTRALSWLGKSFDLTSPVIPTLLVDPMFKSLRGNTEFDVLTTRAGLKP